MGRQGLPILLVEIAANEVPRFLLHKDFRKMALMMAHELMELIQRAQTSCPDDDITKFRVYGILVARLSFEFCIGTVMKDAEGRINFVFHSNSRHWTFRFGQTPSFEAEAAEHCCEGTESIIEPYVEFRRFTETEIRTLNQRLISFSIAAQLFENAAEGTSPTQLKQCKLNPNNLRWLGL